MKQFEGKDLKMVKQEFDKGNNIWFVQSKGFVHKPEVVIILEMDLNGGTKDRSYYFDGKKNNDYDNLITEWNDWNWKNFNFYILTQKETKPYLKKIMMNKMIGEKGKHETI